jgi:hypothetical protein
MSQSMDELMIKTIGVMETLPNRILNLENLIRQLESKLSKHEGEHSSIETSVKKLEGDFEKCKKERVKPETIAPLIKDLDTRQETKKSISQYAKEAFLSFIRYAMLPLTIVLLILIGVDPRYIPWYKPNTPVVEEIEEESITMFWDRVYSDEISERDIYYIINNYRRNIVISNNPDQVSSEEEYRKIVSSTSFSKASHIFVWLPHQSKLGYAQVYDKSGRAVGSKIKILRGF